MGHAQIKIVTSREFVHNVSAAKRVASEGGTVIITDHGEPALALIPIAEYRRLTKTDKNLVELLRMAEADAFDIEFEPIRISARKLTHDGRTVTRNAKHFEGTGVQLVNPWEATEQA